MVPGRSEILNKSNYDFYYSFTYSLSIANSYNRYANLTLIQQTGYTQGLTGIIIPNLSFQPVHPKGDQSWVFIGRTDVEAETPILWPPHAKS